MTAGLSAITWTGSETGTGQLLHRTLCQSLADEAAAEPETIRGAIRALIEKGHIFARVGYGERLIRGKYGELFRGEVRQAVFAPTPDLRNTLPAHAESVWWSAVAATADRVEMVTRLRDGLSSSDQLYRIETALGVMQIAFEGRRSTVGGKRSTLSALSPVEGVLSQCGGQVATMLAADSLVEQYAATWALAWLGERQLWEPPAELNLHATLKKLWQEYSDGDARRMAAWAFIAQPLLPRDPTPAFADGSDLASWLTAERFESCPSREERQAVLALGWYRRSPWSDTGLAELLKQMIRKAEVSTENREVRQLAEQLGVDLNRVPADPGASEQPPD